MTLLQLKYALECSVTGSISIAAQNQFTTTSNMSKVIKSLEDELGYSIFVRSPYGLVPTEKGNCFISHTRNIINECSFIEHLESSFDSTHFILASIPSSFSCLAFSELAKITTSLSGVHIQFHTTTSVQAIADLKNHLCDLAVIACSTAEETMIEHRLRHQGIQLDKVGELPIVVYLAPDHPLLKKYTNDADILKALMHYPYIEFNNDNFLSPHPILPYINKDNIIKINDRVWRLHILKDTNGFASGLITPRNIKDYESLYQITLPDSSMSLFLAQLNHTILPNIAVKYIELLKEKLMQDGYKA